MTTPVRCIQQQTVLHWMNNKMVPTSPIPPAKRGKNPQFPPLSNQMFWVPPCAIFFLQFPVPSSWSGMSAMTPYFTNFSLFMAKLWTPTLFEKNSKIHSPFPLNRVGSNYGSPILPHKFLKTNIKFKIT